MLAATLLLALLAPAGDPVPDLRSEPVPLDGTNLARRTVGKLEYQSGLVLCSSDKRFGGWSALWVSDDGSRLVAVNDEGRWMHASLAYDADGHLAAVGDARIDDLRDTRGTPVAVPNSEDAEKTEQDAEALVRLPDGSWLVAFEHHHRISRYTAPDGPAGPATDYGAPKDLAHAPDPNGGMEALVRLRDGRLLTVAETWHVDDSLRGWVRDDAGTWQELRYKLIDRMVPSEATLLPSGDVLFLERNFDWETRRMTLRLRRVRTSTVRPGALLDGDVVAELAPPITVDNYEGLSARRMPDGRTLVYVLSDDNMSPFQATILLTFAWDEQQD